MAGAKIDRKQGIIQDGWQRTLAKEHFIVVIVQETETGSESHVGRKANAAAVEGVVATTI